MLQCPNSGAKDRPAAAAGVSRAKLCPLGWGRGPLQGHVGGEHGQQGHDDEAGQDRQGGRAEGCTQTRKGRGSQSGSRRARGERLASRGRANHPRDDHCCSYYSHWVLQRDPSQHLLTTEEMPELVVGVVVVVVVSLAFTLAM